MLKKILVSLMAIVLLFSVTACTTPDVPEITVVNSDEVTHIVKTSTAILTPQEVLDELHDIDLSGTKINYSDMEAEKVTDEENSTAIVYYSKDGKRVYAVYEGYGEDCVDFYTETGSGYAATVKYVYPGLEETFTDVSFEKDDVTYNVTYEVLNDGVYYGAELIYVIAEFSGNTFDEYISYCISSLGKGYSCVLESARYIDVNGDYREYFYDEYDELLVGKYDGKTELCNVPAENLENTEILMGPHTVYLGENNEIYIETTLVRVFREDTGVDEFVKDYNFIKSRDINDEFDIAYNDVVLKFADDCKADGYENVFDFATDEYNDYVYNSVSFNEDGEISKVSSGTLSYY